MKIKTFEVHHTGPYYSADTYFYCPGCQREHGLRIGGPNPWTWNGDAERPTFSPSVKVTMNDPKENAICHSFVRDGNIEFLSDCTHALAGQTVPLPDFPSSPRHE